MVRSELAYYVPRTIRTFNRNVLAYRTSVQFLKRTVSTYRTLFFFCAPYLQSI